MQFTQSLFLFYFLPFALVAHRIVARHSATTYSTIARYLLIALTFVFYGTKHPCWLVPLLFSIALDFIGGSLLQKTQGNLQKNTLIFFVSLQVLLLATFKYWNVFGLAVPKFLNFFVIDGRLDHPPGISFYVFESISFLIDVYRGVITERIRLSSVLGFITMFPRFIAGPIVRYNVIEKQVTAYSGMKIEAGLFTFIYGFFIKICLADSLALFSGYASVTDVPSSFLTAWIGVLIYGLQIYFDFSGYSLMAIGLGKCFGFQFPSNFFLPFHALSLQEYWNRWHMSLGSWLKDYLFHPLALALSRRNENLIYLALFLTMTLCGLWHGASANFILWGAWHGLFLCLERRFQWEKRLPRFATRIVTLLIVFFGIGIYRGSSLSEVGKILNYLTNPFTGFTLNPEAFQSHPAAAAFSAYALFHCFWVEPKINLKKMETLGRVSPKQAYLGLALFLFSLIWVLSDNYVPFLYFQF